MRNGANAMLVHTLGRDPGWNEWCLGALGTDPRTGGSRDDGVRCRAPRNLHARGRVHRRSARRRSRREGECRRGRPRHDDADRRTRLARAPGRPLSRGQARVEFWATMYIPIVVMAAQQNVVAAARGGPIVLIAGIGAVALCFACVALISRLGEPRELPPEEVAEIERGGYVIGGDTPPDYAGPAPTPAPALAAGPVSPVKEA